MRIGMWDIVPRAKRMLETPGKVDRMVAWAVVVGVINGASLGLLIPTVMALASDGPVWGLRLGGWLWVLLALAVLSAVVGYRANQVGYVAAMDFIENLQKKIGDQVARLPLGWFGRPVAGKLSRMVSGELMTAGQILAHMLSPMIANGVATVVLLVVSWAWDWRLGLVLTLAVPVLLVIMTAATSLMERGKKGTEPYDVEMSNRIIEFAQCQAALRSCGRSGSFTELETARENSRRAHHRLLWLELLGNALGGAFTQVVVVVLIGLASQLAVTGSLDPYTALAFIGVSLRFTQMLQEITANALSLENSRPLLDSIDEVLTAKPLPEPDASAGRSDGSVELEAVTFGYDDERPVLSDVSFTVPPRTMTALVGPSGCGKTTVARLIARFWDVDSGAVLVGGADVRERTTEDLMAQLSMVFQDVYLFDDTLEANIRVGREDATDEDVREAGRLAGVTEIAERLPDGWGTRVGEGGRALSGGERQRVAIARALLKKSPVVLFDEATSALDPENEDNVVASIRELRKTATVLVIAHKLDTIRHADQIVLFTADGRVGDIGTHDELITRAAAYRGFWDRRSNAVGWRLA